MSNQNRKPAKANVRIHRCITRYMEEIWELEMTASGTKQGYTPETVAAECSLFGGSGDLDWYWVQEEVSARIVLGWEPGAVLALVTKKVSDLHNEEDEVELQEVQEIQFPKPTAFKLREKTQ